MSHDNHKPHGGPLADPFFALTAFLTALLLAIAIAFIVVPWR